MAWVVVYTESRRELTYARHVLEAGIETYVPISQCRMLRPTRKRICTVQPVFPRYVFSRLTLEAPGYLYTLADERGNPHSLDDAIIHEIKERQARGEFDGSRNFYLFRSGEWAIVTAGILQGWIGRVVRCAKNHALIDMEGKRINLGLDILEKANYTAEPSGSSHPKSGSRHLTRPRHLSL